MLLYNSILFPCTLLRTKLGEIISRVKRDKKRARGLIRRAASFSHLLLAIHAVVLSSDQRRGINPSQSPSPRHLLSRVSAAITMKEVPRIYARSLRWGKKRVVVGDGFVASACLLVWMYVSRSLNLGVFLHVIGRKKESVIDGPCAFYRPQSDDRPIFFFSLSLSLHFVAIRWAAFLVRTGTAIELLGRDECKTDLWIVNRMTRTMRHRCVAMNTNLFSFLRKR